MKEELKNSLRNQNFLLSDAPSGYFVIGEVEDNILKSKVSIMILVDIEDDSYILKTRRSATEGIEIVIVTSSPEGVAKSAKNAYNSHERLI